ncbi:MAG: hypothetical protein GF331_12015 [Chitinivibrionales bacterium]|nr:hypothetical protein [Chitinivibrionales bacterium]
MNTARANRHGPYLYQLGLNTDTTPVSVYQGGKTMNCFMQTIDMPWPVDLGLVDDGGYIVTSGNYNMEVIRTDAHGGEVFAVTHDFCGAGESGMSVLQTGDDFVVAGHGGCGNMIAKLHGDGSQMWKKQYQESMRGSVYCGIEAEDGGFMLLTSAGSLFRTNPIGDSLWQRKPTHLNEAYELVSTSDRGFIVAGNRIIKVDSVGQPEWSRSGPLGGTGYAVVHLKNGGFAVAGLGSVMKVNEVGDSVWTATVGSGKFYGISEMPDGDIVAAGIVGNIFERGDISVVRLSPSGGIRWNTTLPGTWLPKSIQATPDSGLVFCGSNKLLKTDGRASLVAE